MPDFSSVEETLFVPLLGRIYASERFPHILLDRQAVELKPKLPPILKGEGTQTQYTLLASAARSASMDRVIRGFLSREPDGVIVELGCGLETTSYRNDNSRATWYGVDLPAVIEYRSCLFGEDRSRLLVADAFSTEWIQRIRADLPEAPILVTASGLFHYFDETRVLQLLRRLGTFGAIEVVFDAVNRQGLRRMSSKYLNQVGHGDVQMHFFVDAANDFIRKIGPSAQLVAERPLYRDVDKRGLKFSTALTMRVSDALNMVKIIHLLLRGRT